MSGSEPALIAELEAITAEYRATAAQLSKELASAHETFMTAVRESMMELAASVIYQACGGC